MPIRLTASGSARLATVDALTACYMAAPASPPRNGRRLPRFSIQAEGKNLGLLNPLIYPFANTSSFHDAASMGSDFAHVGLGSPNLNALFLDLAGKVPGTPDAGASEVGAFLDNGLPAESNLAVFADGATQGSVVVVLRDVNGNLVSGKTVSLKANSGNQATITPANGVTDVNNGAVVFTVTDLTPEPLTFTATDTTDGV